MKKLKWLLGLWMLALVPMLQSCDDDDNEYRTIGWDWATVRTTGGGGYYLEGDRWGTIEPLTTSIPWFKPVDGERVISYFTPLDKLKDGIQVNMEGLREVLTKEVEEMTAENEEEFGDDPIVIYQGDMWLGGKFLNIIFLQDLPRSEKHRISLVENKVDAGDGEQDGESGENSETVAATTIADDGYVHLELRYNTYGDRTGREAWGRVSYNLEKFYPASDAENAATTLKGFKVTIHSKENGKGVVVVLDLEHPVGVPEKAKEVHESSLIK